MKHTTQHLFTLLALTASLGGILTACVPVIIGGAVVGTAMVASDRRTSGAQLEDEGIELRAASRLQEALGDRLHVNVTSYNRRVLLTGEVPAAQDKQSAEQIVSKVDNVESVVNELMVAGNSNISDRSSDALITGKVKAGLVDAKDLFANAFKVVTERGAVYMMGRVTQREADRATEVARSTSGVKKVVRVFEFISEDELRGMMPKPAPGAAKN
ncbi:MAG TPA: BON domain-containing protein [Rhodoferax sp.]|nr:BON domain-containing protein [Rhodoferax sp.]